MFAFLLVSAALAQDSVTCDATDKSGLHYEEWHKSGGAMPGPDTAIATATWKVGATVLSAVVTRYGEVPGGTPTPPAPIRFEWHPDKEVIVKADPNPMNSVTDYTTEVRVWTAGGKPIAPTIPESERVVPMTCQRVVVCCIP